MFKSNAFALQCLFLTLPLSYFFKFTLGVLKHNKSSTLMSDIFSYFIADSFLFN